MSIIFGPVHSRRFGKSLGIDLSPDEKCCNFDCLYCELKPKKPVDKISNPPAIQDIIKELKASLIKFNDIDEVTITANGEPTLYENLGDLVDEIRKVTDKKILILSNGTGIKNPKVFEALKKFDIVKLSIDSVIQDTFRKINRGDKSIKIDELIECMAKFSKEFSGDLILEILVVKNLNDKEVEFIALNETIKKIDPTRVDLSSIDRPPAYKIDMVDRKTLQILREKIEFKNVVVVSRKYDNEKFDFNEDEIMKMINLRSQSEFDIEHNFSDNSKRILQKLIDDNKVVEVNLAGVRFYKINNS